MFLDSPGFQVLSASQMLFLIFASFILGGGGGARAVLTTRRLLLRVTPRAAITEQTTVRS